MNVYIIVENNKEESSSCILTPGYLDKAAAEKELERLIAPRIAYYMWKAAQNVYVQTSKKYMQYNAAHEAACTAYNTEWKSATRNALNLAVLDRGMTATSKAKDALEQELYAEFKEANPMPGVDWSLTHTIEEVEIT